MRRASGQHREGRAVRSGFLAISPNNEILAIVDNGKSLMESGAMHLAEKAGRFWPRDGKGKWRTMEWLMFQMGGVGPMFGQCHHFAKYSKAPYAEERYETRRLYGVMDRRLGVSACLAGAEYGIAVWPWIARFDWQTVDLNDYPNVRRWYLETLDRPAARRGWTVPENDQQIPMP